MSKKHMLYFGIAAVAGYALAATLGQYPIANQAYNLGKNLKQGSVSFS